MKRIGLITVALMIAACGKAEAQPVLPYRAFVPGVSSGAVFIAAGECFEEWADPICALPEWTEGAWLTGTPNCWVLMAVGREAGFGLCQP